MNIFFLIIFINQYRLKPKSSFVETNPLRNFRTRCMNQTYFSVIPQGSSQKKRA
ncbi:hypothetical protein FC25_GL001709 [Ligilactobacillus ruminis DSM 20403 = NBRC 102161]|nr:hypothetical protein FC25_GL001709 [Ligilactobacillus ruminis DSM 20403 = NBRC 102161]